MKLKQALHRVGASIASEKAGVSGRTIFFRVDSARGGWWSDVVASFLLGSINQLWKVDLSKSFFVSGGQVRYLWRFVFTGTSDEVEAALDMFADCALQVAMENAPEVKSMPLVGLVEYKFDPANGKLKGGHGWGSSDSPAGEALVSRAFAGGG